jgi:hypothetical protein
MLKVHTVTRAAAVLAILVTAVSCKTRNPDGEVKHDTRETAGNDLLKPKPPEPKPIENRTFENPNDLKVVVSKTTDKSIAQVADKLEKEKADKNKSIFQIQSVGVNERACKKTAEGGPAGRSNWDCSTLIKTVLKDDFGLEGILIQDWSTDNLFSGSLWNLTACRPSKITLSINRERLNQSELGLGFYIGLQKEKSLVNSYIRNIPANEIMQLGRNKGAFVEADFLLLGICGDVTAEFKPFFNDGNVHSWPPYPNQIIK